MIVKWQKKSTKLFWFLQNCIMYSGVPNKCAACSLIFGKKSFPYSAINKQMVQKKLVTSWFGGTKMIFGGTEMILGVRKWFLGVRKWFGGKEMVFKWLQFHKFYNFNLTSFFHFCCLDIFTWFFIFYARKSTK